MASQKKRSRSVKRIPSGCQSLIVFITVENEPRVIVKKLISEIINQATEKSEVTTQTKHVSVSEATFDKWKRQYPWLIVLDDPNNAKKLMKCKICTEGKVNNVWGLDGSPNIQISSLQRHNVSSEHTNAERESLNTCESLTVCQKERLFESNESSVNGEILFKTVYYCAKEGLPSDKINSLLELQYMYINGAGVGQKSLYKNVSWDTVSEIQNCLADALQRDVVKDVLNSEFFGIMLDESTDIAIEKKLAICIRYIQQGEAKTQFLGNVAIESGHAHVLVNALVTKLKTLGIDIAKLVWLATDGAAVMLGHKTGVGVQLKCKHSPFLVQSHCIAHRLNLAIIDSAKTFKWHDKLKEKLNSLFFFIRGSANRTLKLKQMQFLLVEPEVTIKEPHNIRWIGLKSAVEALYVCYSSVLATLSLFAAEKNAVANGLHKYFSDCSVALNVALMLDVHTILSVLSCQLQKRDLEFSEIQPLMDATIAKLEHLKTSSGEYQTKMENNMEHTESGTFYKGEQLKRGSVSMSGDKKLKYINSLIKNIKSRFRKDDSDVLDHLSLVLEPDKVNEEGNEDQSLEAVECLGTFYGNDKVCAIYDENNVKHETKVKALVDENKLADEWPLLKGMIKGSYKKCNTTALCKRVIKYHSELVPNFAVICKLALCISVTSVECERVFSAQNHLKSKFRVSLKADRLDVLIQIQSMGPDLAVYDPHPAIRIWNAKARRRRSRLYAPYIPRASSSQGKAGLSSPT